MSKTELTVTTELYLSNINNSDSLRYCVNLEKLSILWSEITNLPLENIKKLNYINIYRCKNFINLNFLQTCPELKEIGIIDLNVSSIAFLGKLTKLKILDINTCYNILDYEVLEQCTELEEVKLGNYGGGLNISNIAFLKNS